MALRLLKPDEPARNLGCLVWLEDLERAGLTYGDLLGFLEDLHIPCVCSPIHDRDRYTAEDVRGWRKRHLDPDTGDVADEYTNQEPQVDSPKKPHVHVYFQSRGPRKPRQMSAVMDDLIDGLIAPNRWVLVPDWNSIVRYCAHMDAPNKAQYSPFQIHGFSNADMSGLNEDKSIDKMRLMLEIETAIADFGIPNYYRLNLWANRTGDESIMRMVKGRTAHFQAMFADKRQEWQDRNKKCGEPVNEMRDDMRKAAGLTGEYGGTMEEFLG